MPATCAESPSSDIDVIAVVGPTGVGKTALAEALASRLGGEIISADSMQVYRGMDVGTAKPPPDRRRVPYHCIDLVDPGQPFSAALYQRHARDAIASCAARGVVPIVCGGTGLYVRAALDDLVFPRGEQEDNPIRRRWEEFAARHGAAALHAELQRRDPRAAALVHPNNVRRVVRALELTERGESYAERAAGLRRYESVYRTGYLGLTMPRDLLYARIERRVDEMIAAGLLEEVRRLTEAGFRDAITAPQAIGYKELVPVLEGTASLQDAVERIKRATRRYAKRQLTWFRRDPRIAWLDVAGLDLAEQIAAALDALHLGRGPVNGEE